MITKDGSNMKQYLPSPIILVILCFIVFTILGCVSNSSSSQSNGTVSPVIGPGKTSDTIVLTITGNVDKPMQYTLAQLRSRPFKTETVDFKDNVTANITGMMLNDLLNDSAVRSNATTVTFSSNDNYVKTIALTDIRASKAAMIILGIQLPPCCPSEGESNETLKNVVPGQPYSTWVGKLTTIEVQ